MIDLRANGLSEELVHFPVANVFYNELGYLCGLFRAQNIEFSEYPTMPHIIERWKTRNPKAYDEYMAMPNRLSPEEAAFKVRQYVKHICYPTVIVSHVPYETLQSAMEQILFEPRDPDFRAYALELENQDVDPDTLEAYVLPKNQWTDKLVEALPPWDTSDRNIIIP